MTLRPHMSDGTALSASPTRIENPKRIILEQIFFKTTHYRHFIYFIFHIPKFDAVSTCC